MTSERETQGRQGQEGWAQEGHQEELIFEELSFGREHLFMTDVLCTICAQPGGDAHAKKHHPFTSPGQSLEMREMPFKRKGEKVPEERSENAPGVEMLQIPFDPVLRQALIMKGILTVEDLHNAEEMIRVTTQMFRSEARDGGE